MKKERIYEMSDALFRISKVLDLAERRGAAIDEPEGSRTVSLSDKLAKKITSEILDASKMLEKLARVK